MKEYNNLLLLKYSLFLILSIFGLTQQAQCQNSELYREFKEIKKQRKLVGLDTINKKLDNMLLRDLSCCPDILSLVYSEKAFCCMLQNKLVKAHEYLDTAENNIIKHGLDTLFSRIYLYRGFIHWNKVDYKSALPWHKKAYEFAKNHNNKATEISVIKALMVDYTNILELDSAKIYAKLLFDKSKESKDTILMIDAIRSLGGIEQVDRNFVVASNKLFDALLLAKKIKSRRDIILGYLYLSRLYTSLGNYPKALEYINYYIEECDRIKSYQYLGYYSMFKAYALCKTGKIDEAKEFVQFIKQDTNAVFLPKDSVYFKGIKSIFLHHEKKYDEVIKQIEGSQNLMVDAESFVTGEGIVEGAVKLADSYLKTGNERKSIQLCKQGLGIESNTIAHKSAFAKILSSSYENLGNQAEALKYLKVEKLYQDTIKMLYGDDIIISKEQILNDQQQENEIEKLILTSRLSEYKNQTFKSWIFFLLATSLFIFGLLYYWGRHRKLALENSLIEVKQSLLKLQINPHFTFNVLNSIQNSVLTLQKEKSIELISKFSALNRQVMQNSDKPMVSIHEELKLLTSYMDLEKIRTQNKFDYEIEIGEGLDVYNSEIPSMVLQLFVENSIWHGILPKEEKGLIKIEFKKEKKGLKVSIIDDGIGRKMSAQIKSKNQNERVSMGMSLVYKKIEVLNKKYKKNMRLSIEDGKEGIGTSTMLFL